MAVRIRGIEFGPVHSSSGTQGWFGEGYWFHKWIPGLDWTDCTLVTKTTTWSPRAGNMPIDQKTFEPTSRWPSCIVVKPLDGVVLNSVGLSGPGAKALMDTRRWQALTRPFFLSFMSVANSAEDRHNEAAKFANLVMMHHEKFSAPFGIQINLSCPNAGHAPAEIAAEAEQILGIFQRLRNVGIPIVPKFNVLSSPDAVQRLQGLCDAVCVSNTIPWGELPDRIAWGGLFGRSHDPHDRANEPTPRSPLAHLGGGGLSGRPLLRLVAAWVREARQAGLAVPVSAGGGILRPEDVDVLADAGADSVFLGSIAMLRGWRLAKTIRRAHERLGAK